MPPLVVYNPVSGSGSARSFVDGHVLPLLEQNNVTTDRVVGTEYAGHAGVIVAEYIAQRTSREGDNGGLVVILASGDGTLNEIVNYLSSQSPQTLKLGSARDTLPRISFVLVPEGTANALYSSLFPPVPMNGISTVNYKLQALRSFLTGKSPVPLTLSITTLSSAPVPRRHPRPAISCVVTSTCLHASILHDSEELRKEMPGIERFKVAARQNSKRWYNASVKLLPCPSLGVVQVYEPATQKFVNHDESDIEDPVVDLEGPFIYFLSTVNVDRLEPEFRVTPLARVVPSAEAAYDLVIVRPLRDPSLILNSEEAREEFVDKIWQVMGGAYKDGAHVHLRYTGNGEVVNEGGGPALVEYVRCGGWEWIPDAIDERAHLLCSDGMIFMIETGGRAVSLAATPGASTGFAVYG